MVTTLDAAAAAAEGTDLSAGEAAAGTEIVTASSAEQLDYAAQIMASHQLTHLMVIDPATGHPTEVLSSLDVAWAHES